MRDGDLTNQTTNQHPNVLWIFADQLRHQALGCSGNDDAQTPNIDRLAKQGVICETAVSQSPVCMPFRAGLVTGQYNHVHGVRVHGDVLTPDRRTNISSASPRPGNSKRNCTKGSAGPSWNQVRRFRISSMMSLRKSLQISKQSTATRDSRALRPFLAHHCSVGKGDRHDIQKEDVFAPPIYQG
jgi:hypothetical protein